MMRARCDLLVLMKSRHCWIVRVHSPLLSSALAYLVTSLTRGCVTCDAALASSPELGALSGAASFFPGGDSATSAGPVGSKCALMLAYFLDRMAEQRAHDACQVKTPASGTQKDRRDFSVPYPVIDRPP